MKTKKLEYRLYILVRTDLPSLNPGKAMAQAAHAANQFIHQFGKHQCVKDWQNSTSAGFGTTICLAASKLDIETFCGDHPSKNKIFADEVTDPTYKYSIPKEIYDCIDPMSITDDPIFCPENNSVILFREEVTCGFIFLSEKYFKDDSFGLNKLPLHP